MIYLQLAPMRKILWSIGLLFLSTHSFCQSKAELVKYSFQHLPADVAYVIELKTEGQFNESLLAGAKRWIQSEELAFSIQSNNDVLIVTSHDVSLTGNKLSQLLKQMDIHTILVRHEDEIKEVSLDSYLEKTSK